MQSAAGMARVNDESHDFTCHLHVYPRMKWAILSVLLSRTLTGTHFPSRVGQEAELAWVAGCIPRWFARPKTGHPSRY